MAKKKKPASRINIKGLRRNKYFQRFLPLLILLIGVVIGLFIVWLQPPDTHPKSLIWAADENVTVPHDLAAFLQKRTECRHYKGTNSVDGVDLWAVYQVSKDKFAKISYGCSIDLSRYIMAVKTDNSWLLIPPSEYFANRNPAVSGVSSFLPKCTYIDKYKIDKSIESFCLEADGAARENQLP